MCDPFTVFESLEQLGVQPLELHTVRGTVLDRRRGVHTALRRNLEGRRAVPAHPRRDDLSAGDDGVDVEDLALDELFNQEL